MLGLELISKIYVTNTIAPGTKIGYKHKIYIVERANNGNVLRELVPPPHRGKMVHNLPFPDLLDFLNEECCILKKYTFNEAARRNKTMKPAIISNVDYMNLRDTLSYLASVKDVSLLKRLLEDEVWYA